MFSNYISSVNVPIVHLQEGQYSLFEAWEQLQNPLILLTVTNVNYDQKSC